MTENATQISDQEKVTLVKKAYEFVYEQQARQNRAKKKPTQATLKKVYEDRGSKKPRQENVGGSTLTQGPKEPTLPTPELPDQIPNPEPPPVPEPPKPPDPPPPPFVPDELETEKTVGIATDPERVVQELASLSQHERSRKEPARMFLRGLTTPFVAFGEAVRNFWQNSILPGVFQNRALSFNRSLLQIAREHANIDSTIPLELPAELVDKALEEGHNLRAKGFLAALGYTLYDLGSGLTGFYQNTDMRLARQWFKKNGSQLVQDAKSKSLEDQTQLGERFAINTDDNDYVISEIIGEKRYRLDIIVKDKQVQTEFQRKLKDLLHAHLTGKIDQETLLKDFNTYYREQVLPKLDEPTRKKIEGIEISSNLLALVKDLSSQSQVDYDQFKTKFQRYLDEKKWDELDFAFYIGRANYAPERGKINVGSLQSRLIKTMVEKDYRLDHEEVLGTASTGLQWLKEAAVYGLSYGVGYALGAKSMARSAALGALHLNPIWGTAAMSLTAALREGPAVASKGRLLGVKGKTAVDFEQISREAASGRITPDNARLRKLLEAARVDSRSATELTEPIIALLKQEELTADQQKELLLFLAHAKARLDLTDLTTQKKGLLEIQVTQNFIEYTANKRNEELTRLRAAIVQGAARLSQVNPELYSDMLKVQEIMKAQLSYGSFKEKLVEVVAKQLNLNLTDAQQAVNDYFIDLGIDSDENHKSLQQAAKTLAAISRRRTAQTAALSVALGGAMKLASISVGEALEFTRDWQESGSLTEYIDDWKQVLSGKIPLSLGQNDQLKSDLTSLQKASLLFKNVVIEPPLGGDHQEVINGISITLPSHLEFQQTVINGQTHSGLVDVLTGKVIADTTGISFGLQDFDGDGIDDLALIKPDGSVVEAQPYLSSLGIRVSPEAVTALPPVETVVFEPEAQVDKSLILPNGNRITVSVPKNCDWVDDNQDGKYDLIGHYQGRDVLLIKDAQPNSEGEFLGGQAQYPEVQTLQIPKISEVTSESVPTITTVNGQEIWNAADDVRVVHARSSVAVPMTNEVFATSGTEANTHPWGVRFRFPESMVHNPNSGNDVALSQVGENKVGLLFQLVHPNADGSENTDSIFVPMQQQTINGQVEYVLDLDPADNDPTHLVKLPHPLPNGQTEIQAGALARLILNEEKLAQHNAEGALNSEMSWEGRDYFNLGRTQVGNRNYDGRILGGYFDNDGTFIANHAIHGSAPVLSDEISIITNSKPEVEEVTQNISRFVVRKIVEETQGDYRPQFRLETDSKFQYNLWFVPTRETTEKSQLAKEKEAPEKADPKAKKKQELKQVELEIENMQALPKPLSEADDQYLKELELKAKVLSEELKSTKTGQRTSSQKQSTEFNIKSIPKLEAQDLDEEKEIVGSVSGMPLTLPSGKQIPFEIYTSDEGQFLRGLTTDANQLKIISQNGEITPVKANSGISLLTILFVIFNGQYFKLKDNKLQPLSEVEEKHAQEKIEEANKS